MARMMVDDMAQKIETNEIGITYSNRNTYKNVPNYINQRAISNEIL
jgi:hypothetical protein